MKYLCLVYLDAERRAACSDTEFADDVQPLVARRVEVRLVRELQVQPADARRANVTQVNWLQASYGTLCSTSGASITSSCVR